MDNETEKGKPVNLAAAGKARLAGITSQILARVGESNAEQEKKESDNKKSPEGMPREDKKEKKAREVVTAVRESTDNNISGKRRHPAFKGERIARTFLMPVYVDKYMHSITEKEGIKIQTLIEKGMEKYCKETYPDHDPNK